MIKTQNKLEVVTLEGKKVKIVYFMGLEKEGEGGEYHPIQLYGRIRSFEGQPGFELRTRLQQYQYLTLWNDYRWIFMYVYQEKGYLICMRQSL